jgi:hypothetical protein
VTRVTEGDMSRTPERRQRRSDDELRRQREQVKRQWQKLRRPLQQQREDDTSEERLARVDQVLAECRREPSLKP